MPLDQSDRIKRIEQITNYRYWVLKQQQAQPNIDISSCVGFSFSTIKKFDTYNYTDLILKGRVECNPTQKCGCSCSACHS